MPAFFQKLPGRLSGNSLPTEPASEEEVEAKREYETFCATFEFKPGTNLMKFVEANGITGLKRWLHWSNPEAEPRAFIRLALESARQGERLWEKPGISMYLSEKPSRENQAAISVLAQVLEKPIKLYFRAPSDNSMAVMEFEP